MYRILRDRQEEQKSPLATDSHRWTRLTEQKKTKESNISRRDAGAQSRRIRTADLRGWTLILNRSEGRGPTRHEA